MSEMEIFNSNKHIQTEFDLMKFCKKYFLCKNKTSTYIGLFYINLDSFCLRYCSHSGIKSTLFMIQIINYLYIYTHIYILNFQAFLILFYVYNIRRKQDTNYDQSTHYFFWDTILSTQFLFSQNFFMCKFANNES